VNAGDRAAALTVRCGLPGCDQPPGEPCVSTADSKFQRDNPHYNRWARGLQATSQQLAEELPTVGQWPGDTLSTSARLRQAQQDLAASQADLTRTERERDEALHDLAHATFQLDMERTRVAHWREQNDLARAELVSARQEFEQLLVEYGQARDALDREKSRRSGCPNPITEGAPTMTTTNPGGEGSSTPTATADLMITAAAEAIWPELKSWAQDAYEDTDNIRGWVAAGIAAALRVMADEIEVEPSFPMTAGLAAELIRERAEGLTA
jgi:hypothetical protein